MYSALDNMVVMSTSLLAYLSFATIGNVFLGAIVAFCMKRASLGGLLMAMCPIGALAGMAAPGTTYWVLMQARDTNIDERFLPIIVLPVIFGFYGIFVAIWFTPFRIAQKTDNVYKWLIFAATFFAWVPLVWPLQLYAAIKHENNLREQQKIAATNENLPGAEAVEAPVVEQQPGIVTTESVAIATSDPVATTEPAVSATEQVPTEAVVTSEPINTPDSTATA